MRALYAYEARGADELGLDEGELVELSSGPEGGQHYGDGWWEGTHHYRSEATINTTCRYQFHWPEGHIPKQLRTSTSRLVSPSYSPPSQVEMA